MPLQPPLNEYDVGEEIKLSCLFLEGQTVGRMEKNQATVYVRDPSGLDLTPLAPIVVVGAGYTGGDLRTTVVSNDGVGAIVVADACRTTVSEAIVGTPADPSPVVCTVRQPDGVAASATLTSTGSAPADGDTVTVRTSVYTFKTALTASGATPFEVLIGGDAADALANLKAAINGAAGAGTSYGSGTDAHTSVEAGTLTSTTLELEATSVGTAGNAYASTETSAQLSFGAATFQGGLDDEVTVTVGQVIVGLWQGTFTALMDGDHFYAFNDKWRKFSVRPDRVP